MDIEKTEKKTFSEKLSALLVNFRVIILSIVIVLFLAAVGLGVFSAVKSSVDKKNFALLDELMYSLEESKTNLSEDMLAAKYDSIKQKISEFTVKTNKGAPAARAFMITAGIDFETKNYASSRDAWLSAVDANKKAYTASVCWYNAAVCSEELGETDKALEYYVLAAESAQFSLKPHALFNIARIQSDTGNFEEAKKSFQKIIDSFPNDSWADLAKSNLLLMTAEGKIQ